MGMIKDITRASFFPKEPVNSLTHFAGILLGVIGLGLLAWRTTHPFKPLQLLSCAVFGTGLIMLYTASTLYHWLPLGEKGRVILRKFDHIMIFVLIASTYTPFCLGPFRGLFGWVMLGTVWSIAVLGTAFKIFWVNSPRWISTTIYVIMGWVAVAGAGRIFHALEPGAVFWLVSGGIFYSVGALIYACKRPDPLPGILGFHEIFHIFVMLGSSAHFWVVYRYIAV